MACFRPLTAWMRGKEVSFKPIDDSMKMKLPCGQCVGCRLQRSRDWAFRCMAEASMYPENCFITLTFNEEKLPRDGSLSERDFQLFMKRLRKRFPRKKDDGIRYYHCGEYGETTGRPHYHALLFNFEFPDKELHSVRDGYNYYTSRILDELWGNGYAIIGELTFDSAAYVARYVMKKITGKAADDHYVNKASGVIKKAEYTTMSRRPGIGKRYFDKFRGEIYPVDAVVIKGREFKPPRYFDNELAKDDPDLVDALKVFRKRRATRIASVEIKEGRRCVVWEDDDIRLRVKEQVKLAEMKSLKRSV